MTCTRATYHRAHASTHPRETSHPIITELGIPDCKLVVWATTATGFSIADPQDPFMLDVCGFSADVPELICDFIRGEDFQVFCEEWSLESCGVSECVHGCLRCEWVSVHLITCVVSG